MTSVELESFDIYEPPDGGRQGNDVGPVGTVELVEWGELGLTGGDRALDAVTQSKPGVAADALHFAMESWRALLASRRALVDARAGRIGSRRKYRWIG